SPSGEKSDDEQDHGEHGEQPTELRRKPRHPAEPQCRGDERDHEEYERPVQHDVLLSWTGSYTVRSKRGASRNGAPRGGGPDTAVACPDRHRAPGRDLEQRARSRSRARNRSRVATLGTRIPHVPDGSSLRANGTTA